MIKNNMMNTLRSLVGSRQGTDEAIKGYNHYVFGNGSPYTESNLSGQGNQELLTAAQNALAPDPRRFQKGMDYIDYLDGDPTDLHNLIGATREEGVRRVNIAGHPYIQVRDIYDFSGDIESSIPSANRILNALSGDRYALRHLGVAVGQHIGKPYPVNILLPLNPRNVASTAEINAFRNKTTYPSTKQ